MSGKRAMFWIGVFALVLALGLVWMVGQEFSDGRLYGSKSEGMTRVDAPAGFYIGIVGQVFCTFILSYIGIALVWSKKK